MAGYGITAFIVAIALHGSIAAKVVFEEKDSVVRREPTRIGLDARGELLEGGKDSPEKDENSNVDDTKLKMRNICNIDFVMGAEKSTSCSGVGKVMIDPGWCQEAANLSGVEYGPQLAQNTGASPEPVTLHPKGCFKDACGTVSSNPICYFYNPIDPVDEITTTAADYTGQIVCHRPKHVNGTTEKHGGCASGYQVVDDEDSCMLSAECLGYPPGNPFNIGGGSYPNASKKLDFIRGCLWVVESGVTTAYYNGDSPMGHGTITKGTNICNVSATVNWAQAGATVAGAAHADAASVTVITTPAAITTAAPAEEATTPAP